jgi:hypothetical protein
VDGSEAVGVNDLAQLLDAWGTAPGGPPDFDGEGVGPGDFLALMLNWGDCGEVNASVLWTHANGGTSTAWLMDGTSVLAGSGPLQARNPKWKAVGIGDFDGDTEACDILWRNEVSGKTSVWLLSGTSLLPGSGAVHLDGETDQVALSADWTFAGTGDFDGDGRSDILWRHQRTGKNSLWLMSGRAIMAGSGPVQPLSNLKWVVVGTSDFDGDGRSDILWRHTAKGKNSLWLMSGRTILAGSGPVQTLSNTNWAPVGVDDFNGDGRSDILWRHAVTGKNSLWLMSGRTILAGSGPLQVLSNMAWTVAGTGDFNDDGRADILWHHEGNGRNSLWLMSGRTLLAGSGPVQDVPDPSWAVLGIGD